MAPAALTALSMGDLSRCGNIFGMINIMALPGVLMGNPIAGATPRSETRFVGLRALSVCMDMLAVAAIASAVGWCLMKI